MRHCELLTGLSGEVFHDRLNCAVTVVTLGGRTSFN